MIPKVLIIDDSLTVRMDLGNALEGSNFSTTLCATLAAAREALRTEEFSVIILDVLLPDGDGLELLQELRGAPDTSHIPVMLLSTENEIKDRVRGLKTGADEYVGKPYDLNYVIARAHEMASKKAQPSAQAPAPILVIDDSLTFREELRAALTAAEYSVVTASTAEEGLRIAGATHPRAIIVDCMLPGIDGPTFISRIRLDLHFRRTPCILLTASDNSADELRALEAGADAYVRKDGDTGILLARLSSILKGEAIAPPAVAPTSLLSPKKILAVGGNRPYLSELADSLREEGYDVALAHSGEEALEFLSVQRVDCILLDSELPGLTGLQTCQRIKESARWRDTPLIVLSDGDGREATVSSINSGADDFIQKSAHPQVFKARVRAQLRRKQLAEESRQFQEQLLREEMEAAEARAARELSETRAKLLAELAAKNEELEAFSYSVSHDLRGPLLVIEGYSKVVLEKYGQRLDQEAQNYLQRVCAGTERMSQLIEDLLKLSKIGRGELRKLAVDLGQLGEQVVDELRRREPERAIDVEIEHPLPAVADPRLLKVVLENLIGNAWKYTGHTSKPKIEVGHGEKEGQPTYYIRDNGAGFDMEYAHRLFAPFQRLHSASEFEGTGIGLATVRRIIQRHGGRIWADAKPGEGATFTFTLGQP